MAKKYKVLSVVVILLILLSGGAYIFRGWIRNSVVPSYVSVFYKGDVDTAFNKSFPKVNQELKPYGITFNNPKFQHKTLCGPSFEGFSESVYCNQSTQSDQSTFPANFNDYWTSNSPGLEKQLLHDGWKRASHQPIDSLLRGNETTYHSSLETTYIKYYGKTYCTLSFSAFGARPAQLTVTEDCFRSVAFFHGGQN